MSKVVFLGFPGFAAFGNSGPQVVLSTGKLNPRKLGRIPNNFILRPPMKYLTQLSHLKKRDKLSID